jgi:hypothetical protein
MVGLDISGDEPLRSATKQLIGKKDGSSGNRL